MTALLWDTIPLASLALSLLAAVWARRACDRADRIRKSTAAGDRLEMERVAREAVRRARGDSSLPFHPWRPSSSGPARPLPPTTGNPTPAELLRWYS